ncbi:MAG TPA: tetratricopeptide repeat protein [Elusimicrobiota bacterium]|nr:tetratricopeptide repeat protein [Elusimicrobiota bacterium]
MPAPPLSAARRRFIIVVLAFSAYWPTLKMGFLWDDHVMIETNARIQHWSWHNLRTDFTSDAFEGRGDAYYRPAQLFANRLDYSLWGLRPFGFHLTNFAAHAANAILVDALIIAFGFSPLTALLCATLFAVHPIAVEQLMIIAGRAELFGMTCTLGALLALLQPGAWPWIAAPLIYFIGLLFKESAIVVPLLAALCFYLTSSPGRRYLRLLPLAAVTLPYWILRKAAVGPAWPPIASRWVVFFFFKAFPAVLLRYLALIIFPWNLHSHRMMPHLTHAWPILLAMLIVAGVYFYFQNRRLAAFCLGWYVACFLPKTPGMFYGNFMLDHWAYPALVGVVLPMAVLFTYLWEHHDDRIMRKALASLYFIFLIAWALLVHLNVALRGSDEKMYRWALHFTESHPIKYNLGALLLQTGRPGEAIAYLDEVYQDDPTNVADVNALAQACCQVGDCRRAAMLLEALLLRKPGDRLTLQNLAVARAAQASSHRRR